ncbi:hypothetical protein VLK31_20825 [Variovorax sp. H27-G14]|uniref:hypothetical protein n=1 Tax=Variovorax sp. H27-G14 TaxID=3111914 RepID=UPI0038FC28B8
MTSVLINAAGQYLLGGSLYTGHQLQRAIHCAHSVARAYEIADIANGGDGSVDWSDIDDAQQEAADAMGPLAMRQIIAEACEFNDFEPPRSEVAGAHDAASLLTAEENAEACAEGWSLFTHFGDIVELRLERIDSPDEGDGALPDDAAAWHRVWTRTTPLHLKVIDILRRSSPAEHTRIEAYVHGLEASHAHA